MAGKHKVREKRLNEEEELRRHQLWFEIGYGHQDEEVNKQEEKKEAGWENANLIANADPAASVDGIGVERILLSDRYANTKRQALLRRYPRRQSRNQGQLAGK
jgi:hypothetical protein